ncbi:hypothetical protein CLV79_10929 [Limimaricola soesokkakensis]|uniref:Uncharacterized protein n=2 Tax=Limimaricola soesokkakensis TaxID=1343159 RepID=A0A1X6ZRS9_9RHOB|nr:hypothetical protein [Limimaricola soesokkakensis]PSK84057.1 hypothetical protein CLV79_10929 [Limimaricola soesokkakensis]SLN59721.1 hypothetical protein LOS8367_02869 [Limimaricola soesokkakensis]
MSIARVRTLAIYGNYEVLDPDTMPDPAWHRFQDLDKEALYQFSVEKNEAKRREKALIQHYSRQEGVRLVNKDHNPFYSMLTGYDWLKHEPKEYRTALHFRRIFKEF